MILNYKEAGLADAPPLVMLHGLLGSSRNWACVGRILTEHFRVITVDARNHGSSFHAPTLTFDDMVEDLLKLLSHLDLSSATFMGHSMGGKVAMRSAYRYPDTIDRLFVIDLAPKDYPNFHEQEFEAMNALDLGSLKNRSDADGQLAEFIDDWAFRQFLISNLQRNEAGAFEWMINLPVIETHIPLLSKNVLELEDSFEGFAYFLVGGNSHFVDSADHTDIRFHFPQASIEIWDDSGHNPHFEHRERFVEWVVEKAEG